MVTDCVNCPLRETGAFGTMSKSDVSFLRRFKSGEMQIDPGTPILVEGSNTPQLYTTLRGMGLRYKLLPNGQRQVINFVLPGDFLGLQAGVMSEMKHSIEATTQMTLCVFDRTELWSLFKSQPKLGFDLTWIAAVEEHFMGEALTSVGQMTAIQRICWGLTRFFARCEKLGLTGKDRCRFPYKQQDLADAVGLSLVHTNKTLKLLRERQILSWNEGSLHIMNMDAALDIAMADMDNLAPIRPLI